ncbi:hypothetical protein H8356DRAFT_1343465 [Neocallimastix lanati (nom. inval.)]|nr:hypothetical protein H8356DRAFT_1343465 [Neocallimastix sp. JGI-2020a]
MKIEKTLSMNIQKTLTIMDNIGVDNKLKIIQKEDKNIKNHKNSSKNDENLESKNKNNDEILFNNKTNQ